MERGHAGVSRWRCSPCLCTCERHSVSARRDWWRGNVWRRVCRKEGTRVVAAQWDHYCNAVSNPRAYRLISLFLSLARNSVLLLLSSLYGALMYPAHFHSCDIQSFCVLATIGAHRWYFWWIKNAAGRQRPTGALVFAMIYTIKFSLFLAKREKEGIIISKIFNDISFITIIDVS